MRIRDAVDASTLTGKFPMGKQSPRPPDLEPTRLKTSVEIRPTTDELKLNKTETAWLDVIRSRDYQWIGVQNMSFKIGDDCRYNPDFLVLDKGQLIAFETKGFMRDDALVKLKAAARQFPWLRIILVKRDGKQWSESEVKL